MLSPLICGAVFLYLSYIKFSPTHGLLWACSFVPLAYLPISSYINNCLLYYSMLGQAVYHGHWASLNMPAECAKPQGLFIPILSSFCTWSHRQPGRYATVAWQLLTLWWRRRGRERERLSCLLLMTEGTITTWVGLFGPPLCTIFITPTAKCIISIDVLHACDMNPHKIQGG